MGRVTGGKPSYHNIPNMLKHYRAFLGESHVNFSHTHPPPSQNHYKIQTPFIKNRELKEHFQFNIDIITNKLFMMAVWSTASTGQRLPFTRPRRTRTPTVLASRPMLSFEAPKSSYSWLEKYSIHWVSSRDRFYSWDWVENRFEWV